MSKDQEQHEQTDMERNILRIAWRLDVLTWIMLGLGIVNLLATIIK